MGLQLRSFAEGLDHRHHPRAKPLLLARRRHGLKDGWFTLRASNTEPIVRVIAESSIEDRAGVIAEEVMSEGARWPA